MKLHGEIRTNARSYPVGTEVPWYKIYPFFLLHMLAFGVSGFFLAYHRSSPDLPFLYAHGGIAIVVYTVFYLAIFGVDRVRWMFINAGLGLFGIYAQIDIILSQFGRHAADFPWYVHVIQFLYYVLYTFLLYHFILEVSGALKDAGRRRLVELAYVAGSLLLYGCIYFARG